MYLNGSRIWSPFCRMVAEMNAMLANIKDVPGLKRFARVFLGISLDKAYECPGCKKRREQAEVLLEILQTYQG